MKIETSTGVFYIEDELDRGKEQAREVVVQIESVFGSGWKALFEDNLIEG